MRAEKILKWARGGAKALRRGGERVTDTSLKISEIIYWNRARKRAKERWKARKEKAAKSIWR